MTCARSGMHKTISSSACSVCGSLDQSVTVELVGQDIHTKQGNVGTVTEERDATGAQLQVRNRTPEGAHSDALLTDGSVSLNISGPIQIGRKGESRALDTLLCKLLQEGHQSTVEAGRDSFGEDGILRHNGECLTLQVVSVPSSTTFWRDAILGSVTVAVSLADGVKWVRDAVVAKIAHTPPAERGRTILVLDAALAGVLSAHEIADAYLGLYGDPQVEFGLAGIWLVGPTTSTTMQLGIGSL
jgi:hypothetical protein